MLLQQPGRRKPFDGHVTGDGALDLVVAQEDVDTFVILLSCPGGVVVFFDDCPR